MYQILEICGIPGMGGCINDSQKVIAADPHRLLCCPHHVEAGGGDRSPVTLLTLPWLATMQVIDGHYPHVEMHSSSLSFWQKGLSSDMGKSWMGEPPSPNHPPTPQQHQHQ